MALQIDSVVYAIVYSGDSGLSRYFVGFSTQSKPRGSIRLNSARLYTQELNENGIMGYKSAYDKLKSLGWSVKIFQFTPVPLKGYS